jgi:Kef-type K+ transport system membrane component KefB
MPMIQDWIEWIMTTYVPSLLITGLVGYAFEKSKDRALGLLEVIFQLLTALMLTGRCLLAIDWSWFSAITPRPTFTGVAVVLMTTAAIGVAGGTMTHKLARRLASVNG